MTITLTREEAQSVLDAVENIPHFHNAVIETLRARLAQPEPKDDGYCQACEGDHCTAKTGCVALSNPPDAKWEPLVERLYLPDGTLLSEKIKYTPEGEWQDFKQPKPKPVAWGVPNTRPTEKAHFMMLLHSTDGVQYPELLVPLYTAPPQREWQGLTDEEYEAMAEKYVTNCYFDTLKYALAIEAKLKEKNA